MAESNIEPANQVVEARTTTVAPLYVVKLDADDAIVECDDALTALLARERGIVPLGGPLSAYVDPPESIEQALVAARSHTACYRDLLVNTTSGLRAFHATAIATERGNVTVCLRESSGSDDTQGVMRRLVSSMNRAQALAHVGSWDWDIAGQSLSWSDEIYRIFGLRPRQFAATYDAFVDRIHPDDRGTVTAAVNAALESSKAEYDIEHRVVQPNGTIRLVREKGAVVRDASGTPVRMIGAVHDITDFKRVQEEVLQLNQELEQRVRERTDELAKTIEQLRETLDELGRTQESLIESEKLAALGSLVAGVAHEINTPLGIGVTAASNMEGTCIALRTAVEGGTLTRSALTKFIDTLLSASQITLANLQRAASLVTKFKQVAADQVSGHERDLAIAEYTESVLGALAPELQKHQVEARLHVERGGDVYCDAGTIAQVVSNLVMNAAIHALPNSTNSTVDVIVDGDDEFATLTVRDHGCGMDEAMRKRVFEPFFTTKRSSGGTGLGLHIVHNLVTQNLAGTVDCQSSPGEGSSFVVTFPRRPINSPARVAS
ncbi:MAG: PAS domain-containing sensor histidine kinase [Myxococcales bacterium]|nr:PAS domain-containing sensor histidine kinase [Myxococcales bacterium]